MTANQIGRMTALLLCLPLAGALAQPDADTNFVGERVTYENGAVKVCGEGDGLEPCLDANGQMEKGYNPDVHATEGLPN